MAFDFPASPTVGQVYPPTATAGQPQYIWDGEKWSSGSGFGAIYVSDVPPVNAPVNSLWWESDSGLLFIRYNDGNSIQWVTVNPASVPVVRNYLSGLRLTNDQSVSIAIAPGVAADSTNVAMMSLNAPFNKTTGPWTVGGTAFVNGGLDTGSFASNTWYHIFLIQRPDTRRVDALISLSPTAPTMPSPYTLFRRIGSMLSSGSSQWMAINQNGDDFLWPVPAADISAASITSSGALYALSVPPGVQVMARIRLGLASSTVGAFARISSPDENPAGANVPNSNFNLRVWATGTGCPWELMVRTNTSAQVYGVASASGCSLAGVTFGYIDRRGRDG